MQSAASDLPLLADAAREAGALVRELLRKPVEIQKKSDDSPVTNVDLAVDALLAERLRAARPEYGWLSEESEDDPEHRTRAERVFMLDPIDGTAALIARVPQFTISIGIAEGCRAAAGAIYNPMTDELFLGAPGAGATLNGAPTRASVRDKIEGARMIGERRRYTDKRWPAPWPEMDIFARQSIAYRLGLVASGQADATILFGFKHDWDIAAGAAIVEAAGGRITDPWGEALRFNQTVPRTPGAVAAGAALHPLIIERTARLPDPRKTQAT